MGNDVIRVLTFKVGAATLLAARARISVGLRDCRMLESIRFAVERKASGACLWCSFPVSSSKTDSIAPCLALKPALRLDRTAEDCWLANFDKWGSRRMKSARTTWDAKGSRSMDESLLSSSYRYKLGWFGLTTECVLRISRELNLLMIVGSEIEVKLG